MSSESNGERGPGHGAKRASMWESALRDVRGLDYWRSVLRACGPRQHDRNGGSEPSVDDLGRRELMQLFGASLALAGLSGCVQRPREQILPYVHNPPEITPGVPLDYATSMVTDGYAVGLVVRSNDGRPTKIEGNPLHPASLGASGVFEQASVLSLYDPSRLRGPVATGKPASWEHVLPRLSGSASWRPWFVLSPQSSPALIAWLDKLRTRYPAARFCYDTPLDRRVAYRATQAVFGRPLELQYDFSASSLVLALDSDFLARGPMCLRWARDFSARHRPSVTDGVMSRLYQIESVVSPTGSVADHRWAVRPGMVSALAARLLAEVTAITGGSAGAGIGALGTLPRAEGVPQATWLGALARDLAQRRGASLVIAGDEQPLETHLLALALNTALGNLGHTVRLTEPAIHDPLGGERLDAMVEAIRSEQADAVLILDGNPVLTAPRELELARWLQKVPISAHFTYHYGETSRACQFSLPLSHYLESWGDARAYDGTLSYQQPLIEPIYPARSPLEVVAGLAGEVSPDGRTLLSDYWHRELGARFQAEWPTRLRQGLALDSAYAPQQLSPDWSRVRPLVERAFAAPAATGLELNLRPSYALYDGRFATNAWLQELPDPVTKQSWGNALQISRTDATRLKIESDRIVEVVADGQRVRVPIVMVPGQAEGALTLTLGYGRHGNDTLSDGVGANAYPLRPRDGSFTRSVELRITSEEEQIAHGAYPEGQHDRDVVFVKSLRDYQRHQDFTSRARGPQPSLLPLYQAPHTGPAASIQWAMTIDTTLCTGCSACVIACQSENNVPIVGKEQVQRHREMHWLRIDTYLEGPPEREKRVQQPMLCQHCENAPCEYVCPVNATVHSPDGLNEMVYNRCIGTRFCSNNCPYKVRRFNWFEFNDVDPLTRLQRNPDVTVRERGVMEKCTYCVQRIRGAERQARIERREIRPGEVVTACQQACPTQAIQFGSLSHPQTKMVEWRNEPRVYSALFDLNTRPRTQYLAKIANENPELET